MGRRIAVIVLSVCIGFLAGGLFRGWWPKEGATEARPRPQTPPKPAVSHDLDTVRVLAGVEPYVSEGIRITVEDSKVSKWKEFPVERLIVHERDLMLITNELFAAGARAIAINGERLVATTEIRCVGPAIRINGRSTVPPYEIDAAGDADVLKKAVLMMGGVVDMLAAEKLRVGIETMEELTIPAYKETSGGAMQDENSASGEAGDED